MPAIQSMVRLRNLFGALVMWGGFAWWMSVIARSSESWTWMWWSFFGFYALAAVGVVWTYMTNRQDMRKLRKGLEDLRDHIDDTWESTSTHNPNYAIDKTMQEVKKEVDVYLRQYLQQNPLPGNMLAVENPATIMEEAATSYLAAKLGDLTRQLAKSSKAQKAAEDEVAPYIPLIPRGAIRLANRLRFNLHVAIQRGLVKGNDQSTENLDTARRIGKWTLLSDTWPELAWGIALNPALLARLEGAAAESRTALEGLLGESVKHKSQLREFLRHGTRMSGHEFELVHLEQEVKDVSAYPWPRGRPSEWWRVPGAPPGPSRELIAF